jgi:hypothetical protein
MKHLRFDLYSGYRDDKRYTEKDVFEQHDNEDDGEFIERVVEALLDNANQLRGDENDDE